MSYKVHTHDNLNTHYNYYDAIRVAGLATCAKRARRAHAGHPTEALHVPGVKVTYHVVTVKGGRQYTRVRAVVVG